ncbi:MAG TPA: NAD(P)/FAD-dependent oxidoreductase [Candidatus Dormibacteraeota bacterium]|nr:NAD(P)/FAD-dependent oxidoreductase [Candidatus Dormibacteraeota bacterium]
MLEPTRREHLTVVVVGGGQAGLASGYHLKRSGVQFAILDRHPRIGDSWRRRWSSLKLFTPARIDGLPGMAFPAPSDEHPSRDAMADFLEQYARSFDLPVRSNAVVRRLLARADHFELDLGEGSLTADQVIIATGSNQVPKVPDFARELDPAIRQLTAASYSSPSDLAPGAVLVIGAGNSGSEVALEAASAGHRVMLSGRDTGKGNPKLFGRVPWWIGQVLLTKSTPMGRRMTARMAAGGAPRFWIEAADFERAGVERVGRTVGTEAGRPRLDDGTMADVGTVIWCAGFKQDFDWITPRVVDDSGRALHERGVSSVQRGLYFVGLPFQYSVASALVGGVSRDARYVVRHVVRQQGRTVDRRAVRPLVSA